MKKRIYRSIEEPIRENPPENEKWRGSDKGLILCWEDGRQLGQEQPKMARRAKKGVLPVLSWKGGVKKHPKKVKKQGSLYYLAQWQGLRGEDLDISLTKKRVITCSKTGVEVTFSAASTQFAVP